MKDVNLKKLAEGMSLHQKAQLLFADIDRQRATDGKERLLAPEEEEAIIKDCRAHKQIDALNRLSELYNMTGVMVGQVMLSELQFKLYSNAIGFQVLAMTTQTSQEDMWDEVEYLVEKHGNKKLQQALEKVKERKLTARDHLCLFQEDHQPNQTLQETFVRAFNAYKNVKRSLYMVEYIEQLAEMRLVSEADEEVIASARFEMVRFETFQDWLKIMEVFREYYKADLMRDVEFAEPLFKELMLNPKPLFELTEEEKKSGEDRVDRILSKRL